MIIPKWLIFAFGSAFFAGLTAIFGKLGVAGISSNLATLIRTFIILVLILLIVCFRHEWDGFGSIEPKTWLFLLLSGIATGLSWLCYYHALKIGDVAKVAPIDKLSVSIAILLGVIVLGEKLSFGQMMGCSLIILGSIVLALF